MSGDKGAAVSRGLRGVVLIPTMEMTGSPQAEDVGELSRQREELLSVSRGRGKHGGQGGGGAVQGGRGQQGTDWCGGPGHVGPWRPW